MSNELKLPTNPEWFVDWINRFYIFNRFEENYAFVYTTVDVIKERVEDWENFFECKFSKSNWTWFATEYYKEKDLEEMIDTWRISKTLKEAIENSITAKEKSLAELKKEKQSFFSFFNLFWNEALNVQDLKPKTRKEIEVLWFNYDWQVRIEEELFSKFKRWNELILHKVYED